MEDQPLDYENLEDLVSGDGSNVPSKKQLLELLEGSDISDEMKDKLRGMLTRGAPKLFGTSANLGTMLAILFAIVIFGIILFFGYKLYKSIKDKETKREEKKKAKQMKKKK